MRLRSLDRQIVASAVRRHAIVYLLAILPTFPGVGRLEGRQSKYLKQNRKPLYVYFLPSFLIKREKDIERKSAGWVLVVFGVFRGEGRQPLLAEGLA